MPVGADLGLDLGGRQSVEAAPPGAAPGSFQPAGRRSGKADELRHPDNDDGRLAAAVDDEAIVVAGGEVEDLAELGAGDMGIDAAVHAAILMHQSLDVCIMALIDQLIDKLRSSLIYS
jgi:hypothetical protein